MIDEDWGSYMSVTKCWDEEGRTKYDIAPTLKLVEKAMKMGPPWTRFNKLTERVDIFYVRKTHRGHFSRAWDIFKTYKNDEQPEESEPTVVNKKGNADSKGAEAGNDEDKTHDKGMKSGQTGVLVDKNPKACFNKPRATCDGLRGAM